MAQGAGSRTSKKSTLAKSCVEQKRRGGDFCRISAVRRFGVTTILPGIWSVRCKGMEVRVLVHQVKVSVKFQRN